MFDAAHIPDDVDFARTAVSATSTKAVRDLLTRLPIVSEHEYQCDPAAPERGWRPGRFHWYPVGGDRGNAGRIKHAGQPENPIAERTINAMEALIELERQREVRRQPNAGAPSSPREAAMRYFDLPPLEEIPRRQTPIREQKAFDYARDLAKRIRVRLVRETQPVEYAVLIEDEGIGQAPARLHLTLLSLGCSDKPDKPYLIGVFGQGGSSAYAASEVSWMMSRRVRDLLDGDEDGIGWTVVRRIIPAGRRDCYWEYLAAHPDGRAPRLSVAAADAIGFECGTRIAHLKYNFGKTEPARTLFQSLNHLLFKPVLPYELYTGPAPRLPDPMWGNGFRLSTLTKKTLTALDKSFAPLGVEKRE